MPPVHQADAVHGVQHHLEPAVLHPLPPAPHRGVLEQQAHAVVPHVRAHVDGELERGGGGGADAEQQVRHGGEENTEQRGWLTGRAEALCRHLLYCHLAVAFN